MHIVLIGGTFNPIHYGHLRGAEEARGELGADSVIFVPALNPPHKGGEGIAPVGARLDMVRLAIGDNPRFGLSETEIERGGPSYTLDTVKEFSGSGGRVTLIIGSDSFNEISSWHNYEEILSLSSLAVLPRPGMEPEPMESALPVELAARFCYDCKTGNFVNSDGNSITFLDSTPLRISSSNIRDMIARGLSVRYLLPDAVIEYIENKGLYRLAAEAE